MSDRFQAVRCPSCGAPLDLKPGHDRVFKCGFCGTTIQDQTTEEEENTGQFPKLIIQTATYTPSTITYSSGDGPGSGAGRVIGCVVALIILATVIPIVVGVLGATGLTLAGVWASVTGQGSLPEVLLPGGGPVYVGPDIWSYGAVEMLPSDNDSQPDFVGVASLSDETKRLIYVDLEAESPMRWQSDPLGDEASYVYNPIAGNNSFVYIVSEATLFAVNRQDGKTAWQTTIADSLYSSCEYPCMQVFGQRVVVLSIDGTLQAFNAQTGQPAWSLRLNGTPYSLLNVAGNPAVMDTVEDKVGLQVFNPLDGSLLYRIEPQCVNYIFSDPQEPYVYDPVWVLPDGQSVIFAFGSWDPYCFQRWDGATGTMTWEFLIEEENYGSRFGLDTYQKVLIADAGIYARSSEKLVFISATDGTVTVSAENADYDFRPLGVVQDTLIVNAHRTRGTARDEIWALNSDGSTRWTFVPTSKEAMENFDSEVAYEEGLWTPVVTNDSLFVLHVFSDPLRVGVEKLNLQDGTSSGLQINTLNDFPGSAWISLLGWNDSEVQIVTTDVLRVIDLATGQQKQQWP